MAEIIITIEKLRYITRSLEGKRAPTDKIRVSIVGEWLYAEDLKTGERVDVRSEPVEPPSQKIKVIETGDKDWFKTGIHLRNPSPGQIMDGIEDAMNKGHDTVYVHRIEAKPQFTKRR